MPSFTPLMLATLAKQAFSNPAWVFEPKLDGQRSLLWRRRPTVRLITRNEKDRTSHYPDLMGAIIRQDSAPLIADGEIVAFKEKSHRSRACRSACRARDRARCAGSGRARVLLPVRPDLV